MGEPREFTAHGHSTRCGLCSLSVYGLWVSEESPPVGCSDGLDDAPWTCSHVLASITLGVARVDHMGGDWLPHHDIIRKVIGNKRFDEIVAYARAHHAAPKAGKRREPTYGVAQ